MSKRRITNNKIRQWADLDNVRIPDTWTQFAAQHPEPGTPYLPEIPVSGMKSGHVRQRQSYRWVLAANMVLVIALAVVLSLQGILPVPWKQTPKTGPIGTTTSQTTEFVQEDPMLAHFLNENQDGFVPDVLPWDANPDQMVEALQLGEGEYEERVVNEAVTRYTLSDPVSFGSPAVDFDLEYVFVYGELREIAYSVTFTDADSMVATMGSLMQQAEDYGLNEQRTFGRVTSAGGSDLFDEDYIRACYNDGFSGHITWFDRETQNSLSIKVPRLENTSGSNNVLQVTLEQNLDETEPVTPVIERYLSSENGSFTLDELEWGVSEEAALETLGLNRFNHTKEVNGPQTTIHVSKASLCGPMGGPALVSYSFASDHLYSSTCTITFYSEISMVDEFAALYEQIVDADLENRFELSVDVLSDRSDFEWPEFFSEAFLSSTYQHSGDYGGLRWTDQETGNWLSLSLTGYEDNGGPSNILEVTVCSPEQAPGVLGPEYVGIAAGSRHAVMLDGEGKVYGEGSNAAGQLDVDDWEGITAVFAGNSQTAGLKSDGTVVVTGAYYWDIQPHADERRTLAMNLDAISGWQDIVEVECGNTYTAGLKSDGTGCHGVRWRAGGNRRRTASGRVGRHHETGVGIAQHADRTKRGWDGCRGWGDGQILRPESR